MACTEGRCSTDWPPRHLLDLHLVDVLCKCPLPYGDSISFDSSIHHLGFLLNTGFSASTLVPEFPGWDGAINLRTVWSTLGKFQEPWESREGPQFGQLDRFLGEMNSTYGLWPESIL